jgi:hypothetical protein
MERPEVRQAPREEASLYFHRSARRPVRNTCYGCGLPLRSAIEAPRHMLPYLQRRMDRASIEPTSLGYPHQPGIEIEKARTGLVSR